MSVLKTTAFVLAGFTAGTAFGVSQNANSITEFFSANTLRGLTACLESSFSGFSQTETRTLCASKHALDLSGRVFPEGQGAPIFRGEQSVFFKGELKNTDGGYLLTFVQLEVVIFDEDGKEVSLQAYGNIWAPPFEEIEIDFRFSRIPDPDVVNVEWCDREVEIAERRSCKLWDITMVAGVPI